VDPGGTERPAVDAGSREADPIEFNAPLVGYLCMLVSLIEGRKVTQDEVHEILRGAVRQHSLARERRIDYVLRTLGEKPP